MFAFILESIGTTELLLMLFVGIIVIGLIVHFLNKSTKTNLQKCPFCAEMINPKQSFAAFAEEIYQNKNEYQKSYPTPDSK